MGKNKRFSLLLGAVTGIFILVCTAKIITKDKKPIKLKAITFQGKNITFMDAFFMFQKKVNEQSKGRLIINYVGGPEAIPTFEQIEAVKSGLVDMAYLPAAYYVPQMPEADAVKLSEIPPWEERERGAYDLLNRLHQKKLNVYYLGRFTNGIKFHIYLNKKIDNPNLSGLKIRVTPIYKPFVEALGGSPITIAPGEVYTALERGVVDGYGWPSIKISDFGWHEVTKYVIDPGFYQVDVGIVMNLDSWSQLTKNLQELIIRIAKEVEQEASDYYAKIIKEERRFILLKGVEVLHFSMEDEKKFLDVAYKTGWAQVLAKSPETGAKYRDLVKKHLSSIQ